jgi:hypothetical protein
MLMVHLLGVTITQRGKMIKIGDYVRLRQVPPAVATSADADDELATKQVFQECVGQIFRVRGIGTNSPHGETNHIELWVHEGRDSDSAAYHTIWVEPEYLERVPSSTA